MPQAPQTPRQRTPVTAGESTQWAVDGARRRLATLPPWLAAALPAVLMLIVGQYEIRRPVLGWDENATWIASRRTPGQIIHLAGHFDGVIAPYYLFMHFWMAIFGDSEFWMRAPSLIAVSLGVGVAAEIGRRLVNPGVGLLAGLLLVLVPQLSWYAQEARAYGITFLFATIATLLLYRALDRPSWPRWIAYAGLVTLVGWAHMLGLLVLLGHAYAVLSRWRDGRDRALLRWLVVTPIALVPVLPLVYLGLTQRGQELDWLPPMRLSEVWTAPGDIFGSAAAGLLLIGLALAARWRDRRPVHELAVLAVLPPVVLIGISFVTSPLWVPRYVLFVVPAICLLAALALGGLRPRALAALLLLAAVSVPTQVRFRGPVSHMGPDYRSVAETIARDQLPGDVIVYGTSGTWALRAGIDYQLRGRERPRDVLVQRTAAEIGELDAVQCADEVACLGTAQRVWFFRHWQAGRPLTDAGALTSTLRTDYEQAGMWHFTRATLVLYERRPH